MISICIFSKDRACQLELLLKSVKRFVKDWSKQKIGIIYKASDKSYEAGYELVKQKHPEFTYIFETNFRQDVLNFFKETHKLVMFLVDDDVFINELSTDSVEFSRFLGNDNIIALSPRMHPNVTYCYPTARVAAVPPLTDNTWAWRTAQPSTDWSYPMSVDGNIFRATDILPLVFGLNYRNPNTFEGTLAVYAVSRPVKDFVTCFDKPILVNNPANLVQTLSYNHSGKVYNQPVEWLNSTLLAGKEIDLDETIGQLKDLRAPHTEFPYVFTK